MGNINFSCPECGKNLEIEDTGAGLKVNCPNCDADVFVPQYSPNNRSADPFPLPKGTASLGTGRLESGDQLGSMVLWCFGIGTALLLLALIGGVCCGMYWDNDARAGLEDGFRLGAFCAVIPYIIAVIVLPLAALRKLDRYIAESTKSGEATPSNGLVIAMGSLNSSKSSLPSRTTPSGWSLTSKKAWLAYAVFCILLYLPQWHILTGSRGAKFIPKVSWSLSETFVNYDSLMNMPYIAAKARYPLTILALERKGGIRSPEEPNTINHNASYDRGLERGRAYGKTDRDLNSYDNFNPDFAGQVRIAYGYQPGTPEFGDFWMGYKDGYMQTRLAR